MFKPGQHIPAGYLIQVRSWENDGDDYRTENIYAVQPDHVNQFLRVLQWFEAKEDDLGNEEMHYIVLAERLLNEYHEGTLTKDFIEKYFTLPELIREDALEEEFEAFYDAVPDDIFDDFYVFLSEPVQYDYGFCRNVEKVEVILIEEDIIIPVLPEPIISFDGSYQVRIDGEWVRNRNNSEWTM